MFFEQDFNPDLRNNLKFLINNDKQLSLLYSLYLLPNSQTYTEPNIIRFCDEFQTLINSGADINTKTHFNKDYTIFNNAVEHDNHEFCLKVLQKDAILVNYPSNLTSTYLIHLVKSIEMLELLLGFQAQLNIQNKEGNTILHILAKVSNPTAKELGLIKYVLEQGIDLSIENENKQTALNLANYQLRELIKSFAKQQEKYQFVR